MNKIILNVDYKFTYPEGVEKPSPEKSEKESAELSKSYIEYAVTGHYKDGLNSQFRRTFANIQNRMDQAIASKEYFFEVNPIEYNFIHEAFTSANTKFVAAVAKYVVAFEDANFGSSNA